MQNTLRSPYFLALFASLGLALSPLGCAKGPGDESAGGETGTGDGDGDGDASTDTTGDGDGDGTTGDGDGDGSTTGDGDGDGTTGDGDGDGECMGVVEDGGECNSNCECASGSCYLIPILGGKCGECDKEEGDADCAEITGGGCTPPNPFEMGSSPTCNMGEPGGGCQTDAVCQDGLTCGTVLSVLGGLVSIDTCGECKVDADCVDDPEKSLCAPIVVVEDFEGINTCIKPGTVANNEYCDWGSAMEPGDGDLACASGICSKVLIAEQEAAPIGACGECDADNPCEDNETCTAGGFSVDTGTLTGSTCTPAP